MFSRFKGESSKKNATRQLHSSRINLIPCYNSSLSLHMGCYENLLIIASKFVFQLVTILPRGIQPPFNVIYSCLFIGRRYTCGCKRGERWRPAERESPDRGTSDEMAKKLEDFNDRTCSVQYDATRFNDVPVNPLLSTMDSNSIFLSRETRRLRLLVTIQGLKGIGTNFSKTSEMWIFSF